MFLNLFSYLFLKISFVWLLGTEQATQDYIHYMKKRRKSDKDLNIVDQEDTEESKDDGVVGVMKELGKTPLKHIIERIVVPFSRSF